MNRASEADFERFVRESSKRLLGLACLLTGDRGHAEDLLQTTLLRVARRWRQARGAPYSFARRVLVNLAQDHRRTLRRRPQEALGAIPHSVIRRDAVEDALTNQMMLKEVFRLPLQQRSVIVLRFWEDLSVADTARLLNCSEGTIKSHTHRALQTLKKSLDDGNASASETAGISIRPRTKKEVRT